MTHGLTNSDSSSTAAIVSQRGIVEEMTGDRAIVRIYQNSACGGCQLAGGCGSKSLSGNSGRLVEAYAGEGVTTGSTVNLQMRSIDGVLSVILSFVMPLLLVFIVILSLQSREISEVVLALIALGSIALYYGALSLFRKPLKKRISFTADLLKETLPETCELN